MLADLNAQPGDRVIYRKQKHSLRPGPHAKGVQPAAHGDNYSYEVDKFWTVVAVQPDQKIVVRTRRGKQLTLQADDPGPVTLHLYTLPLHCSPLFFRIARHARICWRVPFVVWCISSASTGE